MAAGGREGEKVVVSRQGLARRGERRKAWETGRLSGAELSRARRVFDEVEAAEREGETVVLEDGDNDEADEDDDEGEEKDDGEEDRRGDKLL